MNKKIIISVIVLVLVGFWFQNCAPDSGSGTTPAATCSTVAGQVTTSGGGSTGLSNYGLAIGSGTISFNNINLTFYGFSNGVGFKIIDFGAVCLSGISAWPGGGVSSPVSATIGHSYLVQFNTVVNGVSTLTYSKFTVNNYTGGVINISYVPNL